MKPHPLTTTNSRPTVGMALFACATDARGDLPYASEHLASRLLDRQIQAAEESRLPGEGAA